MNHEKEGKVIRTYKDTVFRMLFREPERLLELYNAVSGGRYTDSSKLEFVTLENAVYMNMKNDLAFLMDFRLNLYEHQGTVNPNMPYRFLQYVAKEYEKLMQEKSIYSTKLLRLPTPRFVVFYNGTEEQPEERELRLSEAFEKREEQPRLELAVQVLNINYGHNQRLLEQCRTLKEYAQYVDCVRRYKKALPVEQAVDRAVEECIRKGILEEFLRANKAEVKSMSIFEYDEEAVKKLWKKEFYEDGLAEGLEIGRAEGMEIGKAEGMEIGKTEGIEIGKAEGLNKGKEEGLSEGKIIGELQGIELAKKVLRLAGRKVSEEAIAEQLSIPVEKVRQILE